MNVNPNFTWGDLLRMNKSDPQDAVKVLLAGISQPKVRKSRYPTVKPERDEYNLAVTLWESGNRDAAINFLEMLILHPNDITAASSKSIFESSAFSRLSLVSAKSGGARTDANVFVKIFNSGIFRLDPVAPSDRETGQVWIEPGDTYEGPAYFPNLAIWLRHGRMTKLRGV